MTSSVNISPEAVVFPQDIHDCPRGRSQEFVHSEQGGKTTSFIMSSDAGVLDAKVLAAQRDNKELRLGNTPDPIGDTDPPTHDHNSPDHIVFMWRHITSCVHRPSVSHVMWMTVVFV